MPGIAGRSKRRRLSPSCKASVLSGARVPRGREAHPSENEERSSGSHGRTAVERTSGLRGTHHPSRGDAGTEGLRGGSACVRAGRATRCEQNAREVPPPVAVRARQMRCAESSREGASHRRKTGRTLARVGPVPHRASPEARMRGSSARAVPARGRTKAKARGGSSPPGAERGIDAARGGCPCIVVLQKSAVRPRAQRSVKPGSVGSKARAINGAREREPDRRRRQARERRGSSAAKGGRFTSARRSSSRERRVSGEGNVVSSALRRGRDVRRD